MRPNFGRRLELTDREFDKEFASTGRTIKRWSLVALVSGIVYTALVCTILALIAWGLVEGILWLKSSGGS